MLLNESIEQVRRFICKERAIASIGFGTTRPLKACLCGSWRPQHVEIMMPCARLSPDIEPVDPFC